MTAHFTAVLEVTKTEPGSTGNGREWDAVRRVEIPAKPATDRKVDELARIVVRADSLEALTAKLAAHVALIEE
ncbi:hypothetical protein GMYAFLOJ_CDS0039 [Microbacterium phage phiMiGM15]